MSMADSSKELTDQVKRQMNQPEIHESWEQVYRTTENERFFEQAFNDFAGRIGQQPESRALDIGSEFVQTLSAWPVVVT